MSGQQIEDIYPLSPMQQGMLFHTLYAPEQGQYLIHLKCVFSGEFHTQAFEKAWRAVIARHAVLRTTFAWEDIDEPLQVVYRQAELPLIQHDWRGLPPAALEQQIEDFLLRDRAQGFPLTEAPPLRLILIRLSDESYFFLWSYSHILLDGWSLPLLLKEVFAFYNAFSQGQDLHLKLSRPYRDYISWLKQQDVAAAESFWRQKLKGFRMPTPLVLDQVSGIQPEQQEPGYDKQIALLPEHVTRALQELARHYRLTLNTLLFGAWAILLSRYRGEEDIVFGTTVSGRPVSLNDVESMVGLFINTLPARIQVSSSASLIPWLQQLQMAMAEATQYDYIPLLHIQNWSEVPRGVPLFESLFVFENFPVDVFSQELTRKLKIQQFSVFDQSSYPLTLLAMPGQQLSLHALYDRQRFNAAMIGQMLGHFLTLLENIAAKPQQNLSTLPILTVNEQSYLLKELNDTWTEYPREQTIHSVFEMHAARTPDAIALVCGSTQLTYQELNRRANQLARQLNRRGVLPETVVGLCIERSLEMVVGLLAVLKAGGTYVLLDPTFPEERLAFMLENAQIPLLISHSQFLDKLAHQQTHILCLDKDAEAIYAESGDNLYHAVTADRLACIFYTSGSTGEPKGIQSCHRGTLRTFLGVDYVQLNATNIFLQHSPVYWDGLTLELWGALLHGARCVLFQEPFPIPADIGNVIQTYAVTTLWLTASLFNLIVDNAIGTLATVRDIMTGGEALSVPHVRRALKQLPETRIINGYGPAESTVFACCYPIPRSGNETMESIPLGRPISNTQVYLLDQHMQPVPTGIAGEIYIGGEGLARGYLQHPTLTAERFVPNPFSNQTDDRLYRTGDRGRYLPDGRIEFLGRIDHQVKLRGYRIELGEIEATLIQHPNVRTCVVIASRLRAEAISLVAYVVPHEGGQPGREALKDFLKQKLPDYMIPTTFVTMRHLPLTPNGKIDRAALPAPQPESGEPQVGSVEPRTDLEKQVAQIWKQVLGREHVSIHDNFFELGGHSLLAIQTVSRLRNIFQIEFPLKSLFDAPTIANVAEALLQNLANQKEAEEINRLVEDLEKLSEEEAAALLDQYQSSPPSSDAF